MHGDTHAILQSPNVEKQSIFEFFPNSLFESIPSAPSLMKSEVKFEKLASALDQLPSMKRGEEWRKGQ